MAKNGKAKTIIAIVTCALLVAATWTTFILAGSNVKNTAESAKESVVELKKDGCDPVQAVDRRVIVIETKMGSMEKNILTGQQAILDALKK